MAVRECVEIYTDGACSGNPGPGGWAAVLRYGSHERELYGRHPGTTNNMMELQAALEGLAALTRSVALVRVHTDSTYVYHCATGGQNAAQEPAAVAAATGTVPASRRRAVGVGQSPRWARGQRARRRTRPPWARPGPHTLVSAVNHDDAADMVRH